ncbi:MAG: PEP-CTERM sorting domain-containing protein [Phycisphaerae bacterium]|nr:PEP-CTERM sorting domain-containing protein [Phycisphaerae bacterium]
MRQLALAMGVVLVVEVCFVRPALAVQRYWAAGHGYWDEPSNWNPSGVPQPEDPVYINNGGIAQIRYGGQCGDLFLGYDSGQTGGLQIASDAGTSSTFSQKIGYRGTGTLTQGGGWNNVYWDVTLGTWEGSAGTYAMTGGRLDAKYLTVGWNGSGWLQISDPAEINIASGLRFGSDSRLYAGPESTIHMVGGAPALGSAIDNWNTDADDLYDLRNLTIVVENGYTLTTYEVAGDVDGGFSTNFALGSLMLGGSDVGRVQLIDSFDNRPGGGGSESLWVYDLGIGDGSSLDVNAKCLYVAGDVEAQLDVWIGGSNSGRLFDSTLAGGLYLDAVYDSGHGWTTLTVIPEPAAFSLLALGSFGVLRRRRR